MTSPKYIQKGRFSFSLPRTPRRRNASTQASANKNTKLQRELRVLSLGWNMKEKRITELQTELRTTKMKLQAAEKKVTQLRAIVCSK